jgi:lipopolysaccharide transport system ATP-binding protein
MQSELLLIDEVLGVGDGKFKLKATDAMINKINSVQTVVLVSHSMSQVQQLCDRVLWLDNGKVKMLGAAGVVLPEYGQFIKKGQAKEI